MPSTFVSLPVPIVPRLPGVPPLPLMLPGVPPPAAAAVAALTALPTLFTADVPAIFGSIGQRRWGIFDQGGVSVLTVDAVDSVEYTRDYRISDYNVEQGGFFSANKVQLPFQGKVTFLIAQSRESFLNQIEQKLASLDLVSLVTPEITYPSANLIHYGFRRTARRGVTMIAVDVWCEEVRIIQTGTSGSSQSPNG